MPGSGAGGLSYRELGCKNGLGSPALLLYQLPSRIPPPCAYLFAEAVFDTQPWLRKTVVKILIKKTLWVFQSYAVAWEGVGYCPSYWKSVGCFATDVYQVFSLSKKEARKARWLKSKVKDWQVKFVPNFLQHKENQGKDTRKRSISTKYKTFCSGAADLTKVENPTSSDF